MSSKRLPLVLSVKAANWRMHDEGSAEADTAFRAVREKALQNDKQTCRFCGFKALKWQEVHHLNDNHADNRLENLVTACGFCHMVQHIGLAGKNKEAVLAWIPEYTQEEVHDLVRSILVVCRWGETVGSGARNTRQDVLRATNEMVQGARNIEAKLRARTAQAERLFVTSDPLELGIILEQISKENPAMYERRSEYLNGLRLLPLGRRMQDGKDKMPEIIDSWMATGGPFSGMLPRTWESLLR